MAGRFQEFFTYFEFKSNAFQISTKYISNKMCEVQNLKSGKKPKILMGTELAGSTQNSKKNYPNINSTNQNEIFRKKKYV
jgi:hypothetical protein